VQCLSDIFCVPSRTWANFDHSLCVTTLRFVVCAMFFRHSLRTITHLCEFRLFAMCNYITIRSMCNVFQTYFVYHHVPMRISIIRYVQLHCDLYYAQCLSDIFCVASRTSANFDHSRCVATLRFVGCAIFYSPFK
jgi:hypothetical protein